MQISNLIKPAHNIIDLDGHPLRCEIKLSRRKTVQLVLKSSDLLEIKAPLNTDVGTIAQIVLKRRNWLVKHIENLIANPYAEKPRFEDGSTHTFLGRPYTLSLKTAPVKRFSCIGNRFLVSAPNADAKIAEELLYKFYAKEAKSHFNNRLGELWPNFSQILARLYPADNQPAQPKPTLKIRRMKSRFGSMTARGVMTLNTELVRVAPRYIDYVIYHELCHLKYMNHSQTYYNLLQQFEPQWRVLKRELGRLLSLR